MRRAASLFFAILILPLAAAAADLPRDFVKAQSGQFTQGGMVVLHLHEAVNVTLNGQTLPQIDGRTVLGFGRDADLRQQLVFARKGKSQSVSVALKPRSYNIQRIDGLPPAMVTPPDEAWPRIIAQGKLKKKARAIASTQSGFAEGFVWPTRGRITGVYGSQRILNGEPRRPHLGIDIAAPRGTVVVASAAGKVTLADADLYFTGGTVIVEHGHGLSTVYSHLGRVDVREGVTVSQGQQIGTVGSTGRSTGPHLDWRINWYQERLDPMLLAGPMPKN